jgi:DNA-binding NtrC family response regulator
MIPKALIVDDEPAECDLLSDALRAAGFEPHFELSALHALETLKRRPFDVVVTDLNMPIMRGSELCRRVKDVLPNVPVVVVTAFGSIDGAVDAMRAGAYDFITKPFDVDAIGLALRRAVEHHALRWEVDSLRRVLDESKPYGAMLGTSEIMRKLYSLIECVTETDAPVLITGESGTGKELVAREIHRRGKRSSGPFLAINCAAVPEALLESELFGHVRGAFTDARATRQGLFAAASGGTLLLDEIGDMPLLLQAKLLRVLQERTLRPLGATDEVPFDTRVLAATNRDLETAVEQGRFREDLYYRINVIHVDVPPLRARAGDALLLARAFLGEISVRNGKRVNGFSTEVAERILAYDWPGNVRELRNSIERAVTLTRGEIVEAHDLPRKVQEYRSEHLLVVGDDPSEIAPLEEVERRYIIKAIDAFGGNKTKAARALGIGRKTLYRRLEAFGIAVTDTEPPAQEPS